MTKRVVRVCAAALVVAYAEYRFWYILVDIIVFTRELGMAMAVPFGSRANVRELLEMLEVIEATRSELFPTGYRNRTNRAVHHHLGRCGEGRDMVYYDPFTRRKIDEVTAQSLLSATRIITVYGPIGWEHDENVVERAPRDTMCDYRPRVTM